jgi:hypothetical protein
MNAYDLFFWAPFGILAAALVIYALVSIPHWTGRDLAMAPPTSATNGPVEGPSASEILLRDIAEQMRKINQPPTSFTGPVPSNSGVDRRTYVTGPVADKFVRKTTNGQTTEKPFEPRDLGEELDDLARSSTIGIETTNQNR